MQCDSYNEANLLRLVSLPALWHTPAVDGSHKKELKGYRRAALTEFDFIERSKVHILRFKWMFFASLILVVVAGVLEYFFLDFGFGFLDGLLCFWILVALPATMTRKVLPWVRAEAFGHDRSSEGYRIRLWQWWTTTIALALFIPDVVYRSLATGDFHCMSDVGGVAWVIYMLNKDAFTDDWKFTPKSSKAQDDCYIVSELPSKPLFRWLYLGWYPESIALPQQWLGNLFRIGLLACFIAYIANFAFVGTSYTSTWPLPLRPGIGTLFYWLVIATPVVLMIAFCPPFIRFWSAENRQLSPGESGRDIYYSTMLFEAMLFVPGMAQSFVLFGIVLYCLFQYISTVFILKTSEDEALLSTGHEGIPVT